MAGNSPTADIRRWWDGLSPQREFLSQLGILILLGQHFDIDQDLGMTCMKTIKKDKVVLKAYESIKSHWSCWTVLWHKIVLIIQSRSYFCRQNILLALNFEKRIFEHIDVNIDHICHFQSIDLLVYFLPQNILVKLISSVKNLIPWHVSLMLYQITGNNIPMSLPHIYWDWWNNDNDKNKQMNNNLNINAVEIVKKKKKKKQKRLFSSACNAYFSHHSTIF